MPSDSEPDPYEGLSLYQTKAVWRWRVFYGCLVGIVIVAIPVIMVLLLLPAVQQARVSVHRSVSKGNLKQISLALLNSRDLYGVYSPRRESLWGGCRTTRMDVFYSAVHRSIVFV